MAAKKATEAQLRKIMAAGQLARNELQEREEARTTKANAKLIGACQKYRNSYGSGDKWWLYRRILTVQGNWCSAFTFQTCDGGRVEICHEVHSSVDSGWIAISEEEFQAEWKNLHGQLAGWASLNGSGK